MPVAQRSCTPPLAQVNTASPTARSSALAEPQGTTQPSMARCLTSPSGKQSTTWLKGSGAAPGSRKVNKDPDNDHHLDLCWLNRTGIQSPSDYPADKSVPGLRATDCLCTAT